MVTAVRQEQAGSRTKPALIDCDVHNELDSEKDLYPYLSARWLDHLKTYGMRKPSGSVYPRFLSKRNDARPPSGRLPGSECWFTAKQLLDGWNVAYGILNPLTPAGSQLNPDFDAALCTAVNDWQAAEWLDPEPRLRASIIMPFEFPELAVAEIKRRTNDKRFVQVLFIGRPAEPMGRRKYWPIYEACAEHGLVVTNHAFYSNGNPITGCGWPSFYIEDHAGPAQSMQANLISMIVEGVFERFPTLKVISAENGFGWVPPMAWRLDSSYQLFKSEVPHLKRLPSECLRDHVWFCTQPVEEPHRPEDLFWLIDQIGPDRLLFASDYAHWDWDAPDVVLPPKLAEEKKRAIQFENARQLYGFDG
ncbi:MAG: amidohydrolase [Chloroflexi bacterium]|nr:amidohydrolase [Chloroflexota bacterium]